MAQTTVEILIRAQENVSQAVNEVKQQFESLSQHTQNVFGRLTQVFRQNEEALNSLAKMGAVVAGTLSALAVAGARHANQLREEALQIGTTVEKYSLYRAMLQDLEIRAEMLPMFIMRMQVAFQQAAAAVAEKGDKVNELTALIAQFGQTVQTQTNDPLEQFVALLKEIAKIPDQARQAQILFELFGRRAYTLLPILREGAQELDKLIQKYRELGVTISDETAKKIDNLSDAFGTLKAAAKALLAEGLADIAPTLEKIAEGLNKAVAALKQFKEEHPTLSSFVSHLMLITASLGMLAVLLAGVGHGVRWVGNGLKALGALNILNWLRGLVGGFGSLRAALAAIVGAANPVVLAIVAIALAIGGLIRKIEDATGAISKFLAKLMTAKEARKYVDETVTDIEYTREQRERDKEALERFYRERPHLRQLEQEYAQKYYGKVGSLKGMEAPRIELPTEKPQQTEKERREWAEWREKMLQMQRDLHSRWGDYIETLKKQWQQWFDYRRQFFDDIKRKYMEWIDKQKEAVERVARAEEEMRQRMAEAYESAARLAANLAARAGVYHVRFGAFGYFAIPVVQEAQPVAYQYSREDLMFSYTFYIYYYAQQIWLSLQQVITLLQNIVGYLSLLTQQLRIQLDKSLEIEREAVRHFVVLFEEYTNKTLTVIQLFKSLVEGRRVETAFPFAEAPRPLEEEIRAWRGFFATHSLFLEAISTHLYNVIQLLKEAVAHLSKLAEAVTKSPGRAIHIEVPFGYDQIRNAIADAVNETLGKQLAHELVRNV
jgi:ABC-type transporter Mla subunit MlaD